MPSSRACLCIIAGVDRDQPYRESESCPTAPRLQPCATADVVVANPNAPAGQDRRRRPDPSCCAAPSGCDQPDVSPSTPQPTPGRRARGAAMVTRLPPRNRSTPHPLHGGTAPSRSLRLLATYLLLQLLRPATYHSLVRLQSLSSSFPSGMIVRQYLAPSRSVALRSAL